MASFEAYRFKRTGIAAHRADKARAAIFARRKRHTKLLSCIKPPGKAGRLDENGRNAAIFFFIRPKAAGITAALRAKKKPSGYSRTAFYCNM